MCRALSQVLILKITENVEDVVQKGKSSFIYIYIYIKTCISFIYIYTQTQTQSPNTKKNVNSANINNEKRIRSLWKNNFNGLCLIGGKCSGTGDLDPSFEEKEGPQGP